MLIILIFIELEFLKYLNLSFIFFIYIVNEYLCIISFLKIMLFVLFCVWNSYLMFLRVDILFYFRE